MHILIALVAVLLLGVGATIAGINYYAPESIDLFKAPSGPDTNQTADLNDSVDLDVDTEGDSVPQIDLNNASDCTVIFAGNPNPTIQSVGLGFCEFENICNGFVSRLGINPMHIWFGLLILVVIFLFLSYFLTIFSSKATWIMLAMILFVAVLFFFRVI